MSAAPGTYGYWCMQAVVLGKFLRARSNKLEDALAMLKASLKASCTQAGSVLTHVSLGWLYLGLERHAVRWSAWHAALCAACGKYHLSADEHVCCAPSSQWREEFGVDKLVADGESFPQFQGCGAVLGKDKVRCGTPALPWGKLLRSCGSHQSSFCMPLPLLRHALLTLLFPTPCRAQQGCPVTYNFYGGRNV